jgi:hypothetical protein
MTRLDSCQRGCYRNVWQQAAPANYPARSVCPALRVCRPPTQTPLVKLQHPGHARGSRLFNAFSGRPREGTNWASPVGRGPKRLPSKLTFLPYFTLNRICAFTQSGGICSAKLNASTLSRNSNVRLINGFTSILPEPMRANARG